MNLPSVLEVEHIELMLGTALVVASVGLAMGILLFTFVNRRILRAFMEEVRVTQAAAA